LTKNVFVLGLGFSGGDDTSGGVIFVFWPTLRGPGHQSNEAIFSIKFLFESRLLSESLEPLIGFLAYLETKLCHKNSKVPPYKRKPGLNNTQFGYGHNSPPELARELFKPSKDA